MRALASALALSAAAASCAAPEPLSAVAAQPAELAGRTAGQPLRCVPVEATESLRVGDPGTLLYGRGRTIWASRLAGNCTLDPTAILVARPVGSRDCRGDRIATLDPVSRLPGTACQLGDFVPYLR